MDQNWERMIPFYHIDLKMAEYLFAQFDPQLRVVSIAPLLEGCRNSNYLVQMKNSEITFLLRIFPLNDESWRKETKLLTTLPSEIPVQKIYFVGQSDIIDGRTYGIYEFVEGESLARFFARGARPDEEMMIDLGTLLAKLHSHSFTQVGFLDENLQVEEVLPPLETWYSMFLGDHARERLGAVRVSKIEKLVAGNQDRLQKLDQTIALVHGDFRPTNMLIHQGKIRCVLDWEFAMAGHPIADLGQLFRREEYFDQRFRSVFAKAYSTVSGTPLAMDWLQTARLRDLVNLLQMLNGEGEHPQKYRDILKLISSIVAG